jgi:hypothetical protein
MKTQMETMSPCLQRKSKNVLKSGAYLWYPLSDLNNNKRLIKRNRNPKNITNNEELSELEKIKALHEKYILDEMCGNYLDIPQSESDN